MHFRVAVAVILLTAALSACRNPASPEDSTVVRVVRVNGMIRFMGFEGGFWVVRGDDNVSYDPVGGLPASFQVEGLRVRLLAKHRPDLVSFHMNGPIVEIISIVKLQ